MMRKTTTRPQTSKTRRQNLTAEQRRRAERLTRRLTVFKDFAALLDYYRSLPGGFRGSLKPAAPALVAGWTDAERAAERAEWDMQQNLALLVELAEAGVGRRVVVVRPAARRAA